jgi:electron transfer flavoprotein-quinone oxidoreductase
MATDDKVKVDAIVVGGGPAGISAAYTMAKAGLEVIVIERGQTCGTKNVGGLLYGTTLNTLIPKFYEKAPIERPVSRRALNFLGDEEHFAMTFGSDVWSRPPFNNTYIVHRANFDKWYAKELETTGANLVEGMVADELIYEGTGGDRKVVGIKIRGDEMFYADTIILADGSNPLLTERASQELSLKGGKIKQDYALGVKEIIHLPKEKIEDRFNLAPNEGMAIDFFGVPFEGLVGGGFIYTAKDTLHLGFAGRLEAVVHSGLTPSEIMDRFKRHPSIRKYITGGTLSEYSAHLIPEGGYDAVPELTANGLMIAGDAAGFVNMSLYKEGTNHAMESGKLAGETAAEAKQKKDFSKTTLKAYEEKLRKGFVMKDLKKYRKVPKVLEGTPNLFSLYPKKVARLMSDYFTVSEMAKSKTQMKAIMTFLKGLPKFKFVRDSIRAKNLC